MILQNDYKRIQNTWKIPWQSFEFSNVITQECITRGVLQRYNPAENSKYFVLVHPSGDFFQNPAYTELLLTEIINCVKRINEIVREPLREDNRLWRGRNGLDWEFLAN